MPSESEAKETSAAKPTPPAVHLGPSPGIGFRYVWPGGEAPVYPYASLSDPCRPQDVDHSTIRFNFTAPIPSEPSRKAKAISAIRQQLTEAGIKPLRSEPDIRFPAGFRSYLDVKSFSKENLEAAQSVSLSWEGQKLEWHSSGVALPEGVFIGLIDGLPPNTNMTRFLHHFHQWFRHDLDIQSMWANYDFDASGEGWFLGQVAFLAIYKLDCFGDYWIPGYFNFEGRDFELHFRGRGNACTFCLSARRHRHDTEDCEHRTCSVCGQEGHPQRVCPDDVPKWTPSENEYSSRSASG